MKLSRRFSGIAFLLLGGLLTSTFGQTAWTAQTSGTSSQLSSVAWTGSLFVAVGYAGTILTSPDGVTWTSRTSGTSSAINTVTWADNELLAVGYNNALVLTSPDGITWTPHSSNGTAGSGIYIVRLFVSGAGQGFQLAAQSKVLLSPP